MYSVTHITTKGDVKLSMNACISLFFQLLLIQGQYQFTYNIVIVAMIKTFKSLRQIINFNDKVMYYSDSMHYESVIPHIIRQWMYIKVLHHTTCILCTVMHTVLQ